MYVETRDGTTREDIARADGLTDIGRTLARALRQRDAAALQRCADALAELRRLYEHADAAGLIFTASQRIEAALPRR